MSSQVQGPVSHVRFCIIADGDAVIPDNMTIILEALEKGIVTSIGLASSSWLARGLQEIEIDVCYSSQANHRRVARFKVASAEEFVTSIEKHLYAR